MKRRDVLKTFAAMSLTQGAFAASSQDCELPAIIALGTPGMFAVLEHIDSLPPGISRMGISTSEVNVKHFQEYFHPASLIDAELLPEHDHPAPFEVFDSAQWQALVPMLPKQRKWLIIGTLMGETGATLLPLLARYAVENGRQAHVFGIGPFPFESDETKLIASSTQKAVERYASDGVYVWNEDINWCPENPLLCIEDVFEALDKECHAWIMRHCAVAQA